MREFYGQYLRTFQNERTIAGLWNRTLELILLFWLVFLGPALSVFIIAFPYARRDQRMRYPLRIGAFFMLALWAETWMQAHYFAPAVALIFVVILQCMRRVARWRWRQFHFGGALVRAMLFICFGMALFRLIAIPTQLWGTAAWPPGNVDRAKVLRKLDASPGQQLVIVHYDENHNAANEWVYNSADIDHSKVIWARDMGDAGNRELLQYSRIGTSGCSTPTNRRRALIFFFHAIPSQQRPKRINRRWEAIEVFISLKSLLWVFFISFFVQRDEM